MIKTVLFKIALAVWFIAWSPLLLIGLPSRKLTRFFITSDARGVLWLARIIAGIKYKIHYPPFGENGIPEKPNENARLDGKAIIAAKHMSILEVAVLETNIRNSFFIVKRELMWIPIYGWAFWRMGLQPVDRAKGATNMQRLTDSVAKKIMNNMILIIFPEGTRAKPGQKIKLKRGLLFISENLKLPILPVGTDAGLYWPKKGKMKSGTANVYFEPMLPAAASLEEISEAINRHSA
ncbi:MAG: 1-acyl-sn-glycerol-3-phosphate acyltransferase [Rickettsiales bacterium]|jgi:1-acyl-sn-glycerol-3-phosphate acyltransferase|nr:1-acyl-sn-glycerol-3-phosphate acyltransferase [Rickettsiales bacterium]